MGWPVLRHRDKLSPEERQELDSLVAQLTAFLAVGHNSDGTTIGGGSAAPTSASQLIQGRASAGTGAIEALTLSQVLDFVGSAAQGDILYRGAASWGRLPAGTAGQFLQTQGAAANPIWVAAAIGGGAVYSGTGHPQGVVSAAIGSFYQDAATGYVYEKAGGGSTAYGWYLLRPNTGAGLSGPEPFAAFISGLNIVRFNGYGYFMPGPGDAVEAFNPTSVSSTANNYVSGKLFRQVTGAATSGTNTFYASGGTGNVARQSLDDDFDVSIEFRTGADITTVRIWFGFAASFIANSETFATGGAGGILFRYSSAVPDGGWIGQTSISGAANHTESATVAAIAASTTYRLRIRFVRQGTPTAYFSVNDGTEIAVTTNIPPTGSSYFLQFGLTALANSARSFNVRSIGGWQGS
jgi:hypothetical protein